MLGLGSTSQLGIGIAIQLQDQFSGTADKVTRRLNDLKKVSSSAVEGAMRDYRNNAAAISGVATAATLGFYSMARGASEFGHKINQIDILGEGKLGKTKQQLSEFTLGLSRDFATMPSDVADAVLENTRAGVTKGMDVVTKYQLAVSKATGENASSVSERLLGIANAMQIPLEQFPRVANAVTSAANQSMASVYSIGESMEYAAFTANRFNIPLEQTLALVAKLSQSNIKGSSAGTALNNMIQYLGTSTSSMATPKQLDAWKRLGLKREDMKQMVDSGNIFGAIDAVDKAMKGIAPSDKITILRNLTNMRGGRGMMGAWGSNDPDKSLSGLLRDIKGGVSTDVAMRQSKEMMNDPYSQFLKVQVAWEQFKIKWIGAMAPVLMKILKGAELFINFTSKIAASPVGAVLGTVVAIGAPLVAMLFGFRAAALAATIALRGFSGQASFGSLIGAGLDLASLRYGASRGITGGLNSIGRNAAGNPFVKGGGIVQYMGKTYKGGQVLPKSILSGNAVNGLMAGTSLIGAGGAGSAAGGLLGKLGASIGGSLGTKILPWVGRAAAIGGRFLPILGWGLTLWSIYDVLKGMRSDNRQEKNQDPNYQVWKQAMDAQLLSYINPREFAFQNSPEFLKASDRLNQKLTQQFTFNIDGTKTFEKTIEQNLGGDTNQQIPFNFAF